MKKYSKSLIMVCISVGLCIASLSGCGAAGRNGRQPYDTTPQGRNMIGDNMQGVDPNAGPRDNNQIGIRQDNTIGDNIPDRGINPVNPGTNNTGMQYNQQQITEGRGKADNIKRQLEAMREVRNVNVVVLGNSALVGFNTADASVDAAKARDMVINKVKQIDNTITNVMATDSQDMLPGITRLSDDITNNRAADTIGDNFNRMIRGMNNPGR